VSGNNSQLQSQTNVGVDNGVDLTLNRIIWLELDHFFQHGMRRRMGNGAADISVVETRRYSAPHHVCSQAHRVWRPWTGIPGFISRAIFDGRSRS
jgi:hypothetical protein